VYESHATSRKKDGTKAYEQGKYFGTNLPAHGEKRDWCETRMKAACGEHKENVQEDGGEKKKNRLGRRKTSSGHLV